MAKTKRRSGSGYKFYKRISKSSDGHFIPHLETTEQCYSTGKDPIYSNTQENSSSNIQGWICLKQFVDC